MLLFLSLLFIKHYFADFVFQTDEMVKSKGIYGDPAGVMHSVIHAFATLLICAFLGADFALGMMVVLADLILHYHIDWAKMNFGNRDITNKLFWNHLGLDQLAHALTYIWFASVLF